MLESEIDYATKILGHKPNEVELAMLDVMYSEHCSYKSSRPYLKLLPTKGKYVVVGPGADAGVVDVGNGWGVTFKIESHNHPSAIEPYNGAATGVGGIVRDILSMGGFPIALTDSLHFGSVASAHSKWLLKNVVGGIADYGNCMGIPTVSGEVKFNSSYESNCIVNCGCVGLMPLSQMPNSKPLVGQLIVLAGGTTGRDGIKGVSFASRGLTDRSEDDRSAVQIADPLTEKMLVDALEEFKLKKLIHYQKDLGGGGLTCGLTESLGKGGLGAIVNLDRVFLREKGMPTDEVMVSESQERMLLFVERPKLPAVEEILKKYLLAYAVIGETVSEPMLCIYRNNQLLFTTNPIAYTDVPVIQRKEASQPAKAKPKANKDANADGGNEGDNCGAVGGLGRLSPKLLADLLGSQNACSMDWVYRQYDHEVGARTVGKPSLDSALLQLPHTMLSVKTDSNAYLVSHEPRIGTMHVFAENWRNIIARGCLPIAYVDNLNFGNPEREAVMRQFGESVRGMAEASRILDVPCVGGNVSFYNEDEKTGVAILPNPVLMAVGIGTGFLPKPDACRNGDPIYLVNGIDGLYSTIAEFLNKPVAVPAIAMEQEKAAGQFLLGQMGDGKGKCPFKLVHDNSKGLGISALELALRYGFGVQLDADDLFKEGGYLIVTSPEAGKSLISSCGKRNIPIIKVGEIGNGNSISANGVSFDRAGLVERYNILPRMMGYG